MSPERVRRAVCHGLPHFRVWNKIPRPGLGYWAKKEFGKDPPMSTVLTSRDSLFTRFDRVVHVVIVSLLDQSIGPGTADERDQRCTDIGMWELLSHCVADNVQIAG